MKRKIIVLTIFVIMMVVIVCTPRPSVILTDVNNSLAAPSAKHLLGTDNLGRDLYALLVIGGLRTLEVVAIATLISLTGGTFLGIIAGLSHHHSVKQLIQFFSDLILCTPSFIVAMFFSAVFGFSPVMAGIVFGIVNMGEYINQATNLTILVKRQDFITAEIAIGLNQWQLIIHHILPNIYRPLLVFLGNSAGNIVIQYAGLAFIGLGTDITTPDWGTMIYQYRDYLVTDPQLILLPTLAIGLLSLFFHLLFDNTARQKEWSIYE